MKSENNIRAVKQSYMYVYLLQCDKPLQMNHTVGLQDSLWAKPATEHHQQAGEHTQQPDVHEQVEQHQPCQYHTKSQQAPLSQHLSHGTAGVCWLVTLKKRCGDHNTCQSDIIPWKTKAMETTD